MKVSNQLLVIVIAIFSYGTALAQRNMYICQGNSFNKYRVDEIDSITFEHPNGNLTDAGYTPSIKNWEGKKIVWLGTSIPAMGYPTICGQYLNAKVYNEAEGSSMARRGNVVHSDDPLSDDYMGLKGNSWQSALYSLSMSQQEKSI